MMPGICASRVSEIRVSDSRECSESGVSVSPEMLFTYFTKTRVIALLKARGLDDKYIGSDNTSETSKEHMSRGFTLSCVEQLDKATQPTSAHKCIKISYTE